MEVEASRFLLPAAAFLICVVQHNNGLLLQTPPVASNSDSVYLWGHAAPNNRLHIAGPYSGSKPVVMNRKD